MSRVSFGNSRRASRIAEQRIELMGKRKELQGELKKLMDEGGDPEKIQELKEQLQELVEWDFKLVNANATGRDVSYDKDKGFELSDTEYEARLGFIDEMSDDFDAYLAGDGVSLTDPGSDASRGVKSENKGPIRAKKSNSDGKYWLELQRNDPARFEKEINDLEGPAQTNAYTNLQNEVQKENRFWTMMTNLQQANHDTLKSFIGNFRV